MQLVGVGETAAAQLNVNVLPLVRTIQWCQDTLSYL